MVATNPLNFGNNNLNRNNSLSSNSNIARAQNFSVSQIQQKRDRAMASTSIGRVLNKNNSNQTTTSIGRIGNKNYKSTSIFHKPKDFNSEYGDNHVDEVRDRLRYQHIRQMIRERKAKETEEIFNKKVSKYDLGVKTGGAFKTKGKGTFVAKLKGSRRKNPSSFKNLSNKDIKYFNDIVSPHAKTARAGSGISRSVRSNMKMQIEKDRRTGKISSVDAHEFKKMVDNLPH